MRMPLSNRVEQLVAKKRQIKQGAMQELLTGQKRLPSFSGEWETYRFDQLFTVLRNASNSRSELGVDGDVSYVHYGDIHTHPSVFLNPVDLRTFITADKVRTIPRLADGDLLMVDASEDTTAIGKAVEIIELKGSEAVAGLHTMALRCNKVYLADGFKGYIQYLPKVRTALVRLATGVSVYGITKSGVKAIEISVPKPAEQTAIAAILSDMEAEITALEAKLTKARQIKQGHDAGTANWEDSTRMSTVGQPERATQNRVVALFRDELQLSLPRRLDRPRRQQQH